MSADKISCSQDLLDGCTIRPVDELAVDEDTCVEGDLALEGDGIELVGEVRWHG